LLFPRRPDPPSDPCPNTQAPACPLFSKIHPSPSPDAPMVPAKQPLTALLASLCWRWCLMLEGESAIRQLSLSEYNPHSTTMSESELARLAGWYSYVRTAWAWACSLAEQWEGDHHDASMSVRQRFGIKSRNLK
jgi:hypothetical protein